MKLSYRTLDKVHHIQYHDLEQFVEEKLGWKDYNFVVTEECGNDTDHLYHVDESETLSPYDLEEIKSFYEGVKVWNNGYVFSELKLKGLIKPGYYLVSVSW